MEKISLRSNQTRAAQRPPLWVTLAGSALFAELLRKYPRKVARKPVHAARVEHKQPPAAPAQAVRPTTPPATTSQPPAGKPVPVKPVEPTPRDLSFHRPQNGRTGPNGVNGSNGLNGRNGHTTSSQIFRSGSITTTPSVRSSPKPAPPVQIPFEVHTPYHNGRELPVDQKPVDDGNQADKQEKNPPRITPPVERVQRPVVQPTPQPARSPIPQSKPAPSLASFLRQHPELPTQTALLGICEDNLPVLLDLFDPTPGALLAMGDEREKQIELLRSAVTSMVTRNSPRSVQFVVLTCDAPSWQEWVGQQGFDRYCLAVEDADGEMVREWILRLADWTEQRRLGQRSGPPIMLVMDTLSFLPRLSYDVRLNFEWMVREGPPAQIWPLGTISIELAKVLQSRRMLRAFQTRILGYAENPAVYTDLAGLPQSSVDDFREPGQFAVQVGDHWLRFRLFSGR